MMTTRRGRRTATAAAWRAAAAAAVVCAPGAASASGGRTPSVRGGGYAFVCGHVWRAFSVVWTRGLVGSSNHRHHLTLPPPLSQPDDRR